MIGFLTEIIKNRWDFSNQLIENFRNLWGDNYPLESRDFQ